MTIDGNGSYSIAKPKITGQPERRVVKDSALWLRDAIATRTLPDVPDGPNAA